MLDRRELFSALLGTHVAALAGCARQAVPPQGELLGPNIGVGHRIRDGYRPQPTAADIEAVDVVIVGGGIAGLSAARRLRQAGLQDFVVLELENVAGGTARSGSDGRFSYPWGAHYIPTPMADSRALVRLLDEMDVLERVLDDGTPVVAEQYLCRDPQERVFYDGQWHEGLYPTAAADSDDLRQLDEFQERIQGWVARRDSQGRRMFAIPISTGSDDPEVMALDQLSVADWMDQHGWTSPRLRWLVDYSCRDDYGLSIEQTSAWAGLFYFASRVKRPGDQPQEVITWPEGNGRIVEHLASICGSRLRLGHAVSEIKPGGSDSSVDVVAVDVANGRTRGFHAKQVIFASPQFLAPHLIRGFEAGRGRDVTSFRYGSWLVANVHLRLRPQEIGFPMCWDNVIYGSKSLGYVTSTHQIGIDHGPTVLTWYHPFTDLDPKLSRQQLLGLTWPELADLVLADLEIAHPEIRSLTTRLDVMRWGHAMIQPRVGFISSQTRRSASKPLGPVHFAGTDLSGVALMEEAFYHGIRAAEEVLRANHIKTSTSL